MLRPLEPSSASNPCRSRQLKQRRQRASRETIKHYLFKLIYTKFHVWRSIEEFSRCHLLRQ